jgi:hypothetical protein
VSHALTTRSAVEEDGTGRGNPLTTSVGQATDRCALDPKPDGPRYAACGDAVTANVAEWIGRRFPHDPPTNPTPPRKETDG